jgi:hypothetical protein
VIVTGRPPRVRGTVTRVGSHFVLVEVDGTREIVKFYGVCPPDVGARLEFHVDRTPPRAGGMRCARRVRKVRA